MSPAGEHWLLEIRALLRLRIGLKPDLAGANEIGDAVRLRLAACRLQDPCAYVLRLQEDPREFHDFIELLVVPETWFFRDAEPFRCLGHYLNRHWLPAGPRGPLRLLSVPCSTGEEAYSMAMTLLTLGLENHQFTIDGCDISRQALERASAGVFGDYSFRERSEEFAAMRDRFFQCSGDQYILNSEVRDRVRFEQANLVRPDFLAGIEPFHVIFCRNLFIYLDAEARAAVVANLQRLLAPGGLCYVGHVEASSLAGSRFRAFHENYPFGFTPLPEGAAVRDIQWPPMAPVKLPAPKERPAPKLGPSAAPVHSRPMPAPPAQAGPRASPALLAAAHQAADSGRLDEAAGLCEALLRQFPPGAEVFCLLGLIRQAQGDLAAAERGFQKALYLDPQHHEALVHMSLLAQQRGDANQAANFRRRAGQAASERR